jgi:cytochrome c oxidase subunit 2
MKLLVIAETPEAFARWQDAQRQPGRSPQSEEEKRGQTVFLSGTCIMCHTVRGTPANGQVAPDLTHIASRRTIGAGAARNTRGDLAAWIVNPQHIKPGTNMPPNPLSPQDLSALLAYLDSLS